MCSVKQEKQPELPIISGIGSRSDGVHGITAKYFPMLRRAFLSGLAMIAALSLAAAPAYAQRGRDRDQGFPGSQWNAQEDREPQREVPLSDILRDLRGRYGGQHLDAQKAGGRYIIAWITGDGRRLTIEVDAATGRVLSTR